MAAGAGLMLLFRQRSRGSLVRQDTLQEVVAGRSRAAVRAAVAAASATQQQRRGATNHEVIAAEGDDEPDLCRTTG
jgi:hypothetical protein